MDEYDKLAWAKLLAQEPTWVNIGFNAVETWEETAARLRREAKEKTVRGPHSGTD